MGHAMEHLLAPRRAVAIWQRRGNTDLDVEVARAAVILFCLPTKPHEELARQIGPRLSADCVVLTIAKGLDDRGRTPPEILRANLPWPEQIGVIYGPMIAEEMSAERPVRPAWGSPSVRKIAREPVRRISPAPRRHGRLARPRLGRGAQEYLCPGLRHGRRSRPGRQRAWLSGRRRHERDAPLLAELGADPDTASRLAGLGDLITTATSAGSHHHQPASTSRADSATPSPAKASTRWPCCARIRASIQNNTRSTGWWMSPLEMAATSASDFLPYSESRGSREGATAQAALSLAEVAITRANSRRVAPSDNNERIPGRLRPKGSPASWRYVIGWNPDVGPDQPG